MRHRVGFSGAVVCVLFARLLFALSYEDKQKCLMESTKVQDIGLLSSFPAQSFFIGGLKKTTQRKRTAMGMDLTDYLWSKAHEKHRAKVLQLMMKNGRR